jgi:hypothetical protein
MHTNTKSLTNTLTPRQSAYLQAYTDPVSSSFGNSYQSAIKAGYSLQTARNLTHLRPAWYSANIGQIAIISPDDIMRELTAIIQSDIEPTIVRLKAIEMTMRAYSMMVQTKESERQTVTLSLDLTDATG